MNRKHISKTELNRVLELHRRWVYGEEGGVPADLGGYDLTDVNLEGVNLTDANLEGAVFMNAILRDVNFTDAILTDVDIRGADLRDVILKGAILERINFNYCIGNNREIKSMLIGTYLISYYKNILNIGCHTHTVAEWEEFSDRDILEMESRTALDWWKLNKEIVLTLVKREVQSESKTYI